MLVQVVIFSSLLNSKSVFFFVQLILVLGNIYLLPKMYKKEPPRTLFNDSVIIMTIKN